MTASIRSVSAALIRFFINLLRVADVMSCPRNTCMFRCDQNGLPARRCRRSVFALLLGRSKVGTLRLHNAAAGPFSSQPFGLRPVGCFSSAAADPYVSSLETLVDNASPARTALKNSQLTSGETYTYFGDRTLRGRGVLLNGLSNWIYGLRFGLSSNERCRPD